MGATYWQGRNVIITAIIWCYTAHTVSVGATEWPVADAVVPQLALNNIPFQIQLTRAPYFNGTVWPSELQFRVVELSTNTTIYRTVFQTMDQQRQAILTHQFSNVVLKSSGFYTLTLLLDIPNQHNQAPIYTTTKEMHSMPGIFSITPPLLTVYIAVALKQVFIALVLGIWLGSFFVHNYNPLTSLLRTFDTYFTRVINYESGHAQVILFCFLLGGLIGIVQKSGGAQGLGQFVTRFTTTRFRAFIAVVALNILIFFDDYSAILIVGTTFSSITQQVYISKPKFAFIIHGISACFVSMMPISSWVGVEIGYIQGQQGLQHNDPFVWFLKSIPYRFFPLLWLSFIVLTIITGRDFGPMFEFERECYLQGVLAHSKRLQNDLALSPLLKLGKRGDMHDKKRCASSISFDTLTASEPRTSDMRVNEGPLAPKPGTPLNKWYNAAIPFLVVALTTFFGMYFDGLTTVQELIAQKVLMKSQNTLLMVFSNADSFNALMWGSMFGCLTAILMLTYQNILSLNECMNAWVAGIAENILSPIIILLLAWALGDVINELNASTFLATAIGSTLQPAYLPTIVLVLCFAMSFSTGTAFGSMGIMFPLVTPLAAQMNIHAQDDTLLSHCVGAILGGSLFGNVISPIADDTILASMASGIEVTTHIDSMVMYVGFIAVLSIFGCSLPVGFGYVSPVVALIACVVVQFFTLRVFGSVVEMNTYHHIGANHDETSNLLHRSL